ncbi:unnamed protein product [Prorocentrum cordatum]|uniref:Uncharacterized protein n=1 Tax=Prorocentrum cordatum TaxID=2364126 RepID=A0ABN9QMV2_9DINO|nr:unnamed protein product [Polarella glacialis]
MNVGVSAKVAAEGEGSMATEAAYQSGAKWFQFQTDYYFDHDVTVVFGTGGYDGDEHYQYSSNGTYRRVRRVKILMQCRPSACAQGAAAPGLAQGATACSLCACGAVGLGARCVAGEALLGARRGVDEGHSFQVLAWGGDSAELTSPPVFELNLMAHRAGAQLALFLALVVVAQQALSAFGRPVTLLGEDYLARVSIAKIAFCMLVLFRQVVWALPPVQHAAPPEVWRVLGATLVLDALVLALRRIPAEERRGGLTLLWRLGQGACRSTGDFLPFTLMFLLWLASVAVIGAASLLPGLALLFRQALFDIKFRRQHSGSVQLAALAARLAARLASAVALGLPGATGRAADSAAEGGWLRCDLNIAACWLALEAKIALDLWVSRRAAPGLGPGGRPSQVMWAVAVLGSIVLAAMDHGVLHSCCGETGAAAHARPVSGVGRPPRGGGALAAAAQDAALALCIASCLRIHGALLVRWAGRTRRLALTTYYDPSGVVFCDAPQHRAGQDAFMW